MIALEKHRDGVVLPVRAQPAARNTELKGEQEGALKAAVTQVAEKGKANHALLKLLSKRLRLKKSQLQLISGETSRQKRFLIRDISIDELQSRLGEALES
ncbi:MAG: hypothetical protein CMJ64_02065 [Planctomycetaceae bacterium]|nr:hypothetical protein [Planctomycetaceae bacterium]